MGWQEVEPLSADEVSRLREFVRRNRKYGVVGFSKLARDGAVVVYVRDTVKVNKISLPRGLESRKIIFQVVGELRALGSGPFGTGVDRTDYFSVVPAGVSVGHYQVTAGTLGYFVELPGGGRGTLSNNHVYARENKGREGDPIYQPGPYDMRRRGYSGDKYRLGRLYWYVPISFEEYECPFRNAAYKIAKALRLARPGVNYVDLAVSTLERDHMCELLELGPVRGWAEAELNMEVLKSGRTTGVTRGKIVDTAYSGYVAYSRGTAYFEDQLLIKSLERPFSSGGDSGSLVVDEELRFVGLLFAGNEQYTVANPARLVIKYLREAGIKIVGVGS